VDFIEQVVDYPDQPAGDRLLVVVSTIGLGVGKWVHNVGGIIMLTIFAVLLALLLFTSRGAR
jgi:hypothetical protein